MAMRAAKQVVIEPAARKNLRQPVGIEAVEAEFPAGDRLFHFPILHGLQNLTIKPGDNAHLSFFVWVEKKLVTGKHGSSNGIKGMDVSPIPCPTPDPIRSK